MIVFTVNLLFYINIWLFSGHLTNIMGLPSSQLWGQQMVLWANSERVQRG